VIINVKVSQKYIDNGKRKDCHICPVALAIKDIVKPRYRDQIEISNYSIQINPMNYDYIMLPYRVSNIIIKYDKSGVMKPFKFILDIPSDLEYFFRDDLDG